MYFRSYTLTTLFLGWWGIRSFVMTPVILVSNVVQYFCAVGLPEPRGIDLDSRSVTSVNSATDLLWKFGYGIVMWGIVAVAISPYKVDFMHRHAPALNAVLYSNDVSNDVQDAQYAFTKISQDVQAIEADTNSSDWEGFRTELLARAPFFEDVGAQNTEFQSRITDERDQGLVKSNSCGQWVLDDVTPALNNYAAALNHLYMFVKITPEITNDSRESLQVISSRERDAWKRLQQAYAEPMSLRCGKN
jgi:hypothetical protein